MNPHIPPGCWPARLNVHMAAAYVGESSANTFLRRVGTEYPAPAVDDGTGKGRRLLWLKADLDRAIGATEFGWLPPEIE